jgi:hypothetical protein
MIHNAGPAPEQGTIMIRLKLVRRLALAVFVVLIIAGLAVYFNLNRLVRRSIETQATHSLQLQTTLDSARLSIFAGRLNLGDLRIASPQGYAESHMLVLEDGDVNVSYGQLRQQPVRIDSITLNNPRIVIEQVGGKFNFQALLDLPTPEEPLRVMIGKLTVHNATVVIRPGLGMLDKNLTEVSVPLPTLTLENIGTDDSAQNGVALRQVVAQLLAEAARQGSQLTDALTAQFKTALAGGLQDVTQQLGGKLDKALQGTGLENVGKDLTGDLDKKIGGEVKKLFGGEKKK